ncbi:MAG: hypothetical protein HY647_06565 [Acidobacteria bacterium]|nr:hypothetical protein [Acidobacteriota bacterium]
MRIHRVKTLFLAAMTAAILLPSIVEADPKESVRRVVATTSYVSSGAQNSIMDRTKRVWTNDDFFSREPVALEETPAPAENPETAAKKPVEGSQELQQVEKEVREEMLVTARNRQKAYEDTIGIIEGRLQSETSEFRIQVYQKILEDTRGLQKINEQMLKRFEDASASGEPQPGAPQQ